VVAQLSSADQLHGVPQLTRAGAAGEGRRRKEANAMDGVRGPISGAYQKTSTALQGLLRWLTASAFRSMAIFVILTFVPILLLTYYIVLTSIRTAKSEAIAGDREVRNFTAALLRTSFRSEVFAIEGIAGEARLHREMAAHDTAATQAALSREQRRHAEFSNLAVYDLSGNLVASTPGPAPEGTSVANAHWFTTIVASEGPYVSNFSRTQGQGGTVEIGAPVEIEDTMAGVAVGTLPSSVIAGWIRHALPGQERAIYVLDDRRQIIAGPSELPMTGATLASLPAVEDALEGRSGAAEYVTPIRLQSNLVTYTPLPEYHEILLVVHPVRFATYLAALFYDKLVLIALIVFALAAVSGILLRSAFHSYLRYTQEVERGRTKTEALLTSIGEGVFAVDAGMLIIEFNRAAALLSGWQPQQALGRPYQEIVQWVDEMAGTPAPDPVQRAMQEKRPLRLPRGLLMVRRDGARFPAALNAAPVLDDQGNVGGCVVVFSDVSQERELDRMKTEFISIASHQLRTPMSAVKGALALLLEEVLGPLAPDQKEYIRRAYEANERLISLANDLLNIGRIEQGRLQLSREPIEIGKLVEGVVSDYQPRAARYHIRLTAELPQQALTVYGDAVRLREVFGNLIDNAIKYTPENGQVEVRAGTDDAEPAGVVVEVSDNGVGIPEDKLPSLFQKFSRVQNPLSNREFGSGLGLYFAHSIVELHQGRIEVKSAIGKGTTFRVHLPGSTAASMENAPVAAQRRA
jgi:PAS domain S-box-containing protein